MLITDLLDQLRYKSEGADLDFKSAQYCFARATDHQKSEMLKDILAMANSWRDGNGYILLGFKDNRPNPAEVVGISELIDDSRLQEFVNSKVKPRLRFSYEEHLYEGKTVGVIFIPKQQRPFYIDYPYGKLKSNVTYVRRGSSTAEAEPTEVVKMALADAGRGQMMLNLEVLSPDNTALPHKASLQFLQFPDRLPDYSSEPETAGPFGFSPRAHIWHDNRDFWREYAEFAQLNAACIEMKFVLVNCSETSLSSAKLEVTAEPLDGQSIRMLAGDDLPDEPDSQWNSFTTNMPTLPDILERRHARLRVDETGPEPICHVRFGSLLPGEEGRSSDSLAIVPSGPGRLRLKFRVLGAELPAPQLKEQLLEVMGESVPLDIDGLQKMYGRALIERYQEEARHETTGGPSAPP